TEHIETDTGLENFLSKTGKELETLEQQRYVLRLKEKRVKDPEKKEDVRKEIREISAHIVPLRKKKKLAEEIRSRSAERAYLLEAELSSERAVISRSRDRGTAR
ncbi:MAG: hypothetical protein II642_00565, partial [Firmicutes bacterium]|nr:hypothetical protein [Bacillota bacterium]